MSVNRETIEHAYDNADLHIVEVGFTCVHKIEDILVEVDPVWVSCGNSKEWVDYRFFACSCGSVYYMKDDGDVEGPERDK